MTDSIAITSGKGGVGKTTISVNLAIAFKQLMNDVLLLDTDLGMANSHILLGANPKFTLENVLAGEKNIDEVVVNSKSGISLVSGGSATTNLLNLNNNQRLSLMHQIENYLKQLKKTKLIVDVAAGAEDNSVIFANACGRIVVVIVGEPTSFIDAYSLIKTINLKSSFKNFCLVINQVENKKIADNIFLKFQEITSKFLDVKLHYVGFVQQSNLIRKSIIKREPIISSNPNLDLSKNFLKIAHEILKTPENDWGGLSFVTKSKNQAIN